MLLVLLLMSGLLALSCGQGRTVDPPPCPDIFCAAVACESPIPTYQRYKGERCRACDICPQGKKRAAKLKPAVPIFMCPIPMCIYPGPCSVPYEMSYFEVNGQQCPGCPYCPEGYGLDPVELLPVAEPANETRAV